MVGTAVDVDAVGRLLVDVNGTIETITAGDVIHLRSLTISVGRTALGTPDRSRTRTGRPRESFGRSGVEVVGDEFGERVGEAGR